ncbi:MAG: phosphatase PAP2 family protein [Clostridiales Family XIII bacterium]|jgi:hypothetical protein|nr:phosphatase PAP2 family protein [Clostridiales Family XIII bacterium]
MATITYVEAALLVLTLGALAGYRLSSHRLETREQKHAFTVRYLLLPMAALAFMLVGQSFTYNATRRFTGNVPHHNFGTALDAALPLVPFFIVFYLMAYAVIIFAPFWLAMAGGPALVRRYMVSLAFLFAISSAIYLLAPNDVPHAWSPDEYALHTGRFDRLLEFMYDADAPSNGLPSLHNAHIWLPFFLILFNDRSARKLAHLIPVAVLGVLISLSTLLCKEHYLVDVAFTIPLVALIAFFVTKVADRKGKSPL